MSEKKIKTIDVCLWLCVGAWVFAGLVYGTQRIMTWEEDKIKEALRPMLTSALNPNQELDREKVRLSLLKQFPDEWFRHGEPLVYLSLNDKNVHYGCSSKHIYQHYGSIKVSTGPAWNDRGFAALDTDDLCKSENPDAVNPYKKISSLQIP